MRLVLKPGDSLTAVMAGAKTTTDPSVSLGWSEGGVRMTTPSSLNGVTAVTLLTTERAERHVNGLMIFNADTAAATVTLKHVSGGTSYTIITITLQVGYTLVMDENGYYVLDSSGQITQAASLATGNAIALTNTLTLTDAVASGTARRVGGGAFRQVAASTAITGATETEANFDQKYSLPANTLKVGTRVRIRGQGIHTATTAAETHDILLKLGTVTLATFATVDPANSDVFYFDFEFVCRTAGVAGTIAGCGVGGAVTPTTGTAKVLALGSTVVDTTAAADIAVAIDRQGTATDSDSARLDYLAVDVIG